MKLRVAAFKREVYSGTGGLIRVPQYTQDLKFLGIREGEEQREAWFRRVRGIADYWCGCCGKVIPEYEQHLQGGIYNVVRVHEECVEIIG